MTEVESLPEKIAKRKIIVYKSRIDPTVIKLTAEKMKDKLFVKMGFVKPKHEEIRVVSIDKYYEPYIVIDGKYNIDYYKKRVYTLEVDDRAQKVTILNQTFEPETVIKPPEKTCKVIKVEGEECISYEDKAYLILDKSGREISPEQVPFAPSEDNPQKILKEFSKKTGKIEVPLEKEIEIIRSKIVKRPSDAERIGEELFEISEHAIIYSPIYKITFQNVKTGEERTIEIDGVTARVIS